MAQFSYPKNNFSIGEISPRLHGRHDTPTYQNGAKTLENVNILVGGGVTRRKGTHYLGACKTNGNTFLFPCIINSVSYVLEFGSLYIRVWLNGSLVGAPYEVVTPYTNAQIPGLSIVQNSNSIYICHGNHPTAKVVRVADDNWQYSTIDTPLFIRPYGTEQVTITPSAVTGTVTLTASSALFTADWVGTNVKVNDGYVTITGYTSATEVTGTVGASTFHDSMVLTTVTAVAPALGANIEIRTEVNLECAKFETTASATPYSANLDKFVEYSTGLTTQVSSTLLKFTPPVSTTATVKTLIDTYSKTPITMTTSTTPAVLPAGYTLTTVVAPLAGVSADTDWTVQLAAVFGYPSVCAIHEQRIWLSGVAACPETVWSSKTSKLEDFTPGTLADSGCVYLISGNETGAVRHIVSGKILEVYTITNEVSAEADTGLKPDNVQIKQRTTFGSSDVTPVKIGADSVIVVRGGKALKRFAFGTLADQFTSTDLTDLSEHIVSEGVVSMAYNRDNKLLYIVTSTGSVAVMAISEQQGLMGWTRHTSNNGIYKQVIVLPTVDGDEVYFLVMRNGIMSVEKVSQTLNTDAGLTFTGTATATGLDHLEGLSVDILADGAVQPRQVVTGGEVTFPRVVTTGEVGLPYTATLVDLPVDVTQGTIQAGKVRVHEVVVRFLNSKACTINGQIALPRTFAVTLNTDQAPFTGLADFTLVNGWDEGGVVTIQQDKPIDMTVLGIYKKVTSHD